MRQRKPNRRQGIDYTRPGFYFVTICVHNRECLLGEIRDGSFEPNNNEKIIRRCWLELPDHYPHCRLHEFVVMPNHVHGIIEITKNDLIVGAGLKPARTTPAPTMCHSLSEIIRGFKTFSSLAINRANNIGADLNVGTVMTVGAGFNTHSGASPARTMHVPTIAAYTTFRWQRSFYDRVIRNKRELATVKKYILENPRNWMEDEENLWR